ncbi:MAG: DUF423 domain-containing protein [Gemmatimonadota bacterium]|nr:DUF423 domain-containing protein [Gemmatimonadota bacterium]
MENRWLAAGAIFAGIAVAAGAFGAHALGDRLPPDLLDVFETGVRYHLVHALALLVVALAIELRPHRLWDVAGWLFSAGIVVFGGSLYALALTGVRWLGAITPIGGVCFLAGWVTVALAALRSRPGP